MIRILMLGDVVGAGGCAFLREKLPALKQRYQPEAVIANGENSAQGNGILPSSAKQLFDSGVDVITTGNHAFKRREIYDVFDEGNGVIRPANFSAHAPGTGVFVIDRLRYRIAVVNLIGTAYLPPCQNPFDCVDEILCSLDTPVVAIDFHAEATAEKLALAYYLDGRVSAFAGTHTHVQTADGRVLPNGTGYITDLGMCGAAESVLGIKPELAAARFRTGLPTRFETETGPHQLCGACFTIDEKTGRCESVEPFAVR